MGDSLGVLLDEVVMLGMLEADRGESRSPLPDERDEDEGLRRKGGSSA